MNDDMIRQLELAWAAGFFDGEGYIGCVNGDESKRLILSIMQKTEGVLYRFNRAIGNLGNVNGPYNARKSQIFRLEFVNKNAFTVFELIKPYLSEVKLEQGRKALYEWYGYFADISKSVKVYKYCKEQQKLYALSTDVIQ